MPKSSPAPTDMIKDKPSPSLLQQFAHYTQELLSSTQAPSTTSQTESSLHSTPTTPNSHDKVLWAIENSYYKLAIAQLDTEVVEVIDIETLVQTQTLQRYELICFWLPSISSDAFKHYLPTLIRSRDLDAEHTIVVLSGDINLRPYGFVSLRDSPISVADYELSSPDIQNTVPNNSSLNSASNSAHRLQAWQFNLFDYKPRPHWLNADYWANPENWDKYRW